MRFLVTGGAGFIGSYVCENLLAKGHSVVCLDNLETGRTTNLSRALEYETFTFVKGNILHPAEWVSSVGEVTHVIHLAGIGEIVPSISHPLDYLSVNVFGTAQILEFSRNNGVVSFVYAASSSCYGLAEVPTKESAPIDLKHPYAVSKYMGEQLVLNWHSIYGLPTKSIRIFNAYGRRVRTTGSYGAVLGVFLRQVLSDKPLTIVGDGSQSRDYVHASDVAEAFAMAALSDQSGKIWNLGSGRPIQIRQLAMLLSDNFVFIPDRPGEPKVTHADISRISADLGWMPKVNFEEAISEILENIDEWRNAPLWSPESIKVATKAWFEILGQK